MAIVSVTMTSRVLPPISFSDDDLKPGGGGDAPWWLKLIRPSWDVAVGGAPVAHGAPYGDPEEDAHRVIIAAFLVGVFTLISFAILGWRFKRKV